MPTTITVGVVEDSVLYLQKLEKVINASPGLRCVCACETGAAALEQIPRKAPQVVLMDLQLPDYSGIKCISWLKNKLPDTQFMVFTVHEDAEEIFKALEAGASGYLLKRTPP